MLSSCLGDPLRVSSVLHRLRSDGPASVCEDLENLSDLWQQPLLYELLMRLSGEPGPRLLVDGIWFSRSYGGITRVWEQILRCWTLPGLITSTSPISLIDRNGLLAIASNFESFDGIETDPLNFQHFSDLASENAKHAQRWQSDVFLSSWITTCGRDQPYCAELALVHDCVPERITTTDPLLRSLRRRWLLGASAHLAVSNDTATDVIDTQARNFSVSWCHPTSAQLFDPKEASSPFGLDALPPALPPFYVLLPATSALGSYKNPELVLNALRCPGLGEVHLVCCGLAAEQHVASFCNKWPDMKFRFHAAGFTDLELLHVYRKALAVVLPSRLEGFGLPVLEAMAAGGRVLIADSRGLREAGGGAAPRFDPDIPQDLAAWLLLLLDHDSAAWFDRRYERRRQRRLQGLNPDLLGLSLLAKARAVWQGQPR